MIIHAVKLHQTFIFGECKEISMITFGNLSKHVTYSPQILHFKGACIENYSSKVFIKFLQCNGDWSHL